MAKTKATAKPTRGKKECPHCKKRIAARCMTCPECGRAIPVKSKVGKVGDSALRKALLVEEEKLKTRLAQVQALLEND